MLTRHVLCSLGESDCNFQVRMEDEFKTPPRKNKTLPLKVVCLLMLLDWPEEEFRIHCASFNDNDIPLSPNSNVGWDTHRCSQKGVFFLVADIYPQKVILTVNIEFGGKGGRPESSRKSSARVAIVQQRSSSRHREECFFLAGWSHSIHFHPKLIGCHSIRPANKACVRICQRSWKDKQLNKTT